MKMETWSLGISIDYTLPAARAAKSVVVQVNHELPRTGGDSCINASDANIAAIVEHDAPIIELAPPKIGDVDAPPRKLQLPDP